MHAYTLMWLELYTKERKYTHVRAMCKHQNAHAHEHAHVRAHTHLKDFVFQTCTVPISAETKGNCKLMWKRSKIINGFRRCLDVLLLFVFRSSG